MKTSTKVYRAPTKSLTFFYHAKCFGKLARYRCKLFHVFQLILAWIVMVNLQNAECFYNIIKGANDRREHRGGQRHPWTSGTPEELQMRCWPKNIWLKLIYSTHLLHCSNCNT